MPLDSERLRRAREKKGYTQDELAQRCDVRLLQIFRYEKGLNDPSSTILTALARELDVSADYLIGLSDSSQGQLGESLNGDEIQLIAAYRERDTKTMLRIIADQIERGEA